MKPYDLSQPLNQDAPFWPFYPPFEAKFFKRKSEHGVNAQYIKTSNHMGTHLDAPRHFVTGGKTIDELPLEWLYGEGVIVDLSDAMAELEIFTPQMIEDRAEIKEGDILFIHTGWHNHQSGNHELFRYRASTGNHILLSCFCLQCVRSVYWRQRGKWYNAPRGELLFLGF